MGYDIFFPVNDNSSFLRSVSVYFPEDCQPATTEITSNLKLAFVSKFHFFLSLTSSFLTIHIQCNLNYFSLVIFIIIQHYWWLFQFHCNSPKCIEFLLSDGGMSEYFCLPVEAIQNSCYYYVRESVLSLLSTRNQFMN
jgi:hypothetical protein